MQCGKQLPDTARFCSACGAAQDAAPVYNEPPRAQRAAGYAPQQPAYPQQPSYPQSPGYAPQRGALLLEAGKVSSYSGAGAVGTITGTGDLFVFDDRIEYHKKTGSQSGYMFGPIIGAALSANDAKKNPVDTYRFSELRGVRKGKYAGLKETLVLELRNGKSVSFVPASKKSDPDNILPLISPYLR